MTSWYSQAIQWKGEAIEITLVDETCLKGTLFLIDPVTNTIVLFQVQNFLIFFSLINFIFSLYR